MLSKLFTFSENHVGPERELTYRVLGLAIIFLVMGPGIAHARDDAGTTSTDAESRSECRRAVADYLAQVNADAGAPSPEVVDALAAEVCTDDGFADVSVEDVFDEQPTVSSTSWTEDLIAYGIPVLLYGGLFVAIWLIIRSREEQLEDVMNAGDPAFEDELTIEQLRQDGALLDEIRGKVDSVCLQRTASEGRVRYAGFVIDINGETHEFVSGEDWEEVEADAEWLADQLDVPLEDGAYG